jgi:hypothetical protein
MSRTIFRHDQRPEWLSAAGLRKRMGRLIKGKPRPKGQTPPQALNAPSNSGLDIVHAVSASDGYVTAMIPVASSRANNHCA